MNDVCSRRTVLTHFALLAAAGAGAQLLGACAPEDEVDGTESEIRSCSQITDIIGANHGHTVTVPPADVAAGTTKTYELAGPHTHHMTLTAAHFATLKSTASVQVVTTTDLGHSHPVTVTCAGPDAGDAGAADAAADAGADRCQDGAKATQISANHGHLLLVPAADVTRGASKTYSIKGTATHDHMITVSTSDFIALRNGAAITKISTTGAGHTHSVVVRCA